MAKRNRLPPWHERLRLLDGRDVLIRPIRPDDAAPLSAGFPLLQPDQLRQRFLQARRRLGMATPEQLARPDLRREFALVVAEPYPPGEAMVGAVAHAALLPRSTREAEFTILISRYISGLGLGRHLLQRVVRWAHGRKLHRLHGDLRDDDQPMLALARSLGFTRTHPQGMPGWDRMVLELEA